MTGRALFYVGFRSPLWPEVQERTTADPAVVLYLTPGGRWDQLGFAPRLEHKHSPSGFNWGYGGSGPAELARHLIWHATGRRALLERPDLYQDFKREVVTELGSSWLLSGDMIRRWVAEHDHGDPFALDVPTPGEGRDGERSGAAAVFDLAGGRPGG